jgi:hypothetical protein
MCNGGDSMWAWVGRTDLGFAARALGNVGGCPKVETCAGMPGVLKHAGCAEACACILEIAHKYVVLCATGSEYKIDASYLSPNVNLASRLEAATKQYSVPMLLSRDFVDCLSPGVRAKVCITHMMPVWHTPQPVK